MKELFEEILSDYESTSVQTDLEMYEEMYTKKDVLKIMQEVANRIEVMDNSEG